VELLKFGRYFNIEKSKVKCHYTS